MVGGHLRSNCTAKQLVSRGVVVILSRYSTGYRTRTRRVSAHGAALCVLIQYVLRKKNDVKNYHTRITYLPEDVHMLSIIIISTTDKTCALKVKRINYPA